MLRNILCFHIILIFLKVLNHEKKKKSLNFMTLQSQAKVIIRHVVLIIILIKNNNDKIITNSHCIKFIKVLLQSTLNVYSNFLCIPHLSNKDTPNISSKRWTPETFNSSILFTSKYMCTAIGIQRATAKLHGKQNTKE